MKCKQCGQNVLAPWHIGMELCDILSLFFGTLAYKLDKTKGRSIKEEK